LKKKPEQLIPLLAEQLEYYEDPSQLPLTNISDVVACWQEIKAQNIEYIQIEVLHECKNVACAMWKFKQFGHPEEIGCYFLKLNDQGKCVVFRQW
jgi:hypothetical protein